jgi:drug/metabolite transporter (DMT)-like permease
MTASKILGLVLIAAGLLGLIYGGFSYTKDSHNVKLGPIELTVKEKESVNVPVWAGAGAIVIGAVLLAFGGRK